ncbi:hypothetical protein BJV82DRAFT_667232 [Fennellomyces sp. T-0311]|nr:hypothetical protein BJV82DRAFT_667232 [Fennellomyces sp. T-0311]
MNHATAIALDNLKAKLKAMHGTSVLQHPKAFIHSGAEENQVYAEDQGADEVQSQADTEYLEELQIHAVDDYAQEYIEGERDEESAKESVTVSGDESVRELLMKGGGAHAAEVTQAVAENS